MSNLDIEIYMTNFEGFFSKNPDQLKDLIGKANSEDFFNGVRVILEKNSENPEKPLEPTKQQIIDLVLTLNGVTKNIDKIIPFMTHHMGLICMN